LTIEKPHAEVLIEGELSPFEHETLYRILRKNFQLELPSYTEATTDDLTTLVNLTFHYPYDTSFFTEILGGNWRDLKALFKQIQYRRGKAGAAFKLHFIGDDKELSFNPGTLDQDTVSSAFDQIGHLTGIIGQMMGPQASGNPVKFIEAFFDKASDRWNKFTGLSTDKSQEFTFDEKSFRWLPSQV
jgi:hypothetical protein